MEKREEKENVRSNLFCSLLRKRGKKVHFSPETVQGGEKGGTPAWALIGRRRKKRKREKKKKALFCSRRHKEGQGSRLGLRSHILRPEGKKKGGKRGGESRSDR